MAPYVPEEVDVFTVPHSRMMELVNDYFDLMKTTNFTNSVDLEALLKSLMQTFMEFKIHEQIENKLIMKRLKNKLKRLSIKNSAVCNCHKDNRMTEIVKLLKDGYSKTTEQDRQNYETQLKAALEDFTSTFIPHMREEEEVFQPLLLKYFSYEELRDLKQKVIYQHVIEKNLRDQGIEKHVWEDVKEHESSTSESEDDDCKGQAVHPDLCYEPKSDIPAVETQFGNLPPELTVQIFSFLSVRDLCRASQVSKRWNDLAYDPDLWRNVLPVQWATGDMSFVDHSKADDDEHDVITEEVNEYVTIDDDADIDESEVAHGVTKDIFLSVQRETKIINCVTKHVLPRLGKGVHRLVLSNSKALTNSMLNKMLMHTPNLEHLDLTQTRVSDSGFKSLGKNKCGSRLQHLILSGCVNITNATLIRLAMALSRHKNTLEEHDCLCEEFYRFSHRKIGDCLISYCRKTKTKTSITEHESPLLLNKSETVEKPAPEVRDDADFGVQEVLVLNARPKAGGKNENVSSGANIMIAEEKDSVGDIEDGIVTMCNKNGEDTGRVQSSVYDMGHMRNHGVAGACHVACNSEEPIADNELVLENCDELIDISPNEYCNNSGKMCKNASKCCLNKKHKRLKDFGLSDRPLEYLDFSGCFQVTDSGLRALWGIGRFPNLRYLDLSGCFYVTAAGLEDIVSACPNLDHAQLYYCDNVEGGPFENTASGCRNLECNRRFCCRNGH